MSTSEIIPRQKYFSVWSDVVKNELKITQDSDDDNCIELFKEHMSACPTYDSVVQTRTYRTNKQGMRFVHVAEYEVCKHAQHIIEAELGNETNVLMPRYIYESYGISQITIEGNWTSLVVDIGPTQIAEIRNHSNGFAKQTSCLSRQTDCGTLSVTSGNKYLPFAMYNKIRLWVTTGEKVGENSECKLSYKVVRNSNANFFKPLFTISQPQFHTCRNVALQNGIGMQNLCLHGGAIDKITFRATSHSGVFRAKNVRMQCVWLELLNVSILFIRKKCHENDCDEWELCIPDMFSFNYIDNCKLSFRPEDSTLETIDAFTEASSYNLLKYDRGCVHALYTA